MVSQSHTEPCIATDIFGGKFSQNLSVAPQSADYPSYSPYNYTLSNPIRLVDPDGKCPIIPIIYYFATAKALERYGGNKNLKTGGYFMQHPINAFRIGEYNEGSRNISTIASNFEINIVNNTHGFTRGEEGTHGNAIRHAIWQGIITKEINSETAFQAGNAHEDDSKVDLNKRIFSNLDDAGQTADLLNNIIGRSIGEDNPNANNQEIAERVIDEYHTNGLWQVEQTG